MRRPQSAVAGLKKQRLQASECERPLGAKRDPWPTPPRKRGPSLTATRNSSLHEQVAESSPFPADVSPGQPMLSNVVTLPC